LKNQIKKMSSSISEPQQESESQTSKVGSLEEESLKRKQRLKALKRGLITTNNDDKGNKANEEKSSSFPLPLFRNYQPKDDSLKSQVLPRPELIEIENEISDRLEKGKPELLIEKEIDLTTLAPQKVDWDLKRDVEKRLRLLEKRTQRAIVDLIRDRLKESGNKADLAELVSVVESNNNNMKNKKKSSDDESESESEEEDLGRKESSEEEIEEETESYPTTTNNLFTISDSNRHISDDDDEY